MTGANPQSEKEKMDENQSVSKCVEMCRNLSNCVESGIIAFVSLSCLCLVAAVDIIHIYNMVFTI